VQYALESQLLTTVRGPGLRPARGWVQAPLLGPGQIGQGPGKEFMNTIKQICLWLWLVLAVIVSWAAAFMAEEEGEQ
jgi:hypothetical protein